MNRHLLYCLSLGALLGISGCSGHDQQSTTAVGAQCSKDTDCKGDRVCDKGACTAPGLGSSSSSAASLAPSLTLSSQPESAAPASQPLNIAPQPERFSGRWKAAASDGSERNINIPKPGDKATIAQLRTQCGASFQYKFYSLNSAQAQKLLKDAIRDTKGLLDNPEMDESVRQGLAHQLGVAQAVSTQIQPSKQYMGHAYRCGENHAEYVFFSPTQGVVVSNEDGNPVVEQIVR